MSQRVSRGLICCSLVLVGIGDAAASGCSSGVGGSAAGGGFSAFQGPALWGNLVLLALTVGIFMSTLGLRK